ncbi:acetyl-CoA synthetase-like protein [Trichodelitschia bisporula]|uniref:Acetyl-CoA synthetase-like protein n=1 Tax=Trichodelitschia bisporula TaxID=703511 RepID=A0A6G1I8P9_9PEZI|nr:acetyl-CoA synthetase-like protein [Trichodelitschia bisporula]
MPLVTAAAAAAGATAAAAYLNAKFHITKDINSVKIFKENEETLAQMIKTDRMSLFYRFEDTAKRLASYPNELCIWSREGSYTWSAAYDQVLRYAQFFLSQGIKPRELSSFYLTNSAEFIFSLLGLWAIASAPAMLNHHLGGDALMHCIKLSGAKSIIVDWEPEVQARIEEVRDELEALGVKIIVLDAATKAHINSLEPIRPPDSLRSKLPTTFPFALIYTSGSTGQPKAVAFHTTRGHFLASPRANNFGIVPGPNGSRYYDCMPMYHGTGGTVAITCMLTGVTLCIGKRYSTSRFWHDIRDSGSTAFVYVGETARYLLSAPPSPRDKDHKVTVMFGNGLRPDVWKRFQERFGIDTVAEFFNSTEGMLVLLNVCRGETPALYSSMTNLAGPFFQACVGHHGAILRWKYRDYYVAGEIDHDTGELYRDPKTGFGRRKTLDEGGEIIVQVDSPEAFPGYWNNPEATDKKFTRNLFRKGDIWYRTGDALRRDNDGRWFFLDRLGDTFRWKSENVATAEVAQVLGQFEGVAEAIVYGVEIPGHDGRAGCAAIHLGAGMQPTAAFFDGLLAHAQKHLPKYAVPVFLRLQPGARPMHNNKQNKTPLKREGIDPTLVYGEDKDVEDAREAGNDMLYWWPAILGHPNPEIDGEGYVLYKRCDWDQLKSRAAGVKSLL